VISFTVLFKFKKVYFLNKIISDIKLQKTVEKRGTAGKQQHNQEGSAA
jgi:hypothetical protein